MTSFASTATVISRDKMADTDHKQSDNINAVRRPRQQFPEASSSERNLAIELAEPTQIYTAGSRIGGLVHLGSKDFERITEVKVSLVCMVRSYYEVNMGESSNEFRRETTKLVNRDQTLWACENGELNPPRVRLPFELVLPDAGNDTRAKDPNTPLPPSFHAGSHRGWKYIMTYGGSIGYIKYYVQVTVVKKGKLKHRDKAKRFFMFLPPSPPPPLLPPLPENIPEGEFALPKDKWSIEISTTPLRRAVISIAGHASLSLWLPRVSSFTRRTSVLFFLCLAYVVDRVPAAQLAKATLFLRQKVHSCARSGRQTHITLFTKEPTDDILHGLVPQNKPECVVWRGRWTTPDIPNFNNRQLSLEYALVAEIPIKGLGNSAKPMSSPLEVSSGVTTETNVSRLDDNLPDFPPGYFDVEDDGSSDEDDHDKETVKY